MVTVGAVTGQYVGGFLCHEWHHGVGTVAGDGMRGLVMQGGRRMMYSNGWLGVS